MKIGAFLCDIMAGVESGRYADIYEAAKAANSEKMFPIEWINAEGNDVSDEALYYFLPLIQGEVMPIMNNGMPTHLVIE